MNTAFRTLRNVFFMLSGVFLCNNAWTSYSVACLIGLLCDLCVEDKKIPESVKTGD